MRRIPGLRRIFRLPTSPSRVAGDVDDEVAFHLEMQQRDLEAQGMSPADARAEALRRFGDVREARAELSEIGRARVRRAWRAEWWEALAKDVHFAARTVARQPTFAAFVVVTLALGIGANSAMFSIADALVLRSLPVPNAARMTLLSDDPRAPATQWTNPIWEAIRDRPALHDGAFAYSTSGFDLSERGVVDPVEGLRASGGIFDVLGVHALVGRTFTPADDRRDGGPDGPVAVLGYGFWQRRYGGGDVIGKTIMLDRVAFTIVGVTPASFFGPEVGRTFDVAIPLNTVALIDGNASELEERSDWWLTIMLRLPQGESVDQATARLRAVQRQIADATKPLDADAERAARHLSDPLRLTQAAIGMSDLRGAYQKPVMALLAIVALTLLIACGNIANLMLARTAARRHELSVRTALGASGGRLARLLFVESLLLALAGATLAVFVSVWGSRLIVAQLSAGGDRVFLPVSVDWRMLGFTCLVAVSTAMLFGTVPALRAARSDPGDAMKEQSRSTSSGRRRLGLAGTLVVAQVALSLVLLIGAGLLVRTFASLATVDLGFEKDRVLLVNIGTRRAGVDSLSERVRLYGQLLDATRAVPGVASAALSDLTPLGRAMANWPIEIPERPELGKRDRAVFMNTVTPRWFATLGTPVIAGRDFDESDRAGAPRVMIVNRAFVAKYLGEGNPLGRRVFTPLDRDLGPLEIVGVVGDAVYSAQRKGAPPTMYWPLAQRKELPDRVSLLVRASAGSPAALTRSVETAVMGVNRDLALAARPLADQVDARLSRERLVATLSGFFGALALLLAALGLYGVTAYAVTRRQIELGIRMALGSTPIGVVRLVLGRVGLLVAGGVMLGAMLGWWATRYIESLLYGLAPHDPVTIIGAIVVLAGVAGLAGWLPAARAARIDPARVLREG